MLNNLINQNPMLNQFNGYIAQNPNIIPFQDNLLINQNVHVVNNLTDLLRNHKQVQQNMPNYQQQLMQTPPTTEPINTNKKSTKTTNIIEEMLKPQKIIKNNKDLDSNYQTRKGDYQTDKQGNLVKRFKMTNAPYKNIIKDKIITKNVEEVKEADLLVHKSIREIDANREKFNIELETKTKEKEKINDELQIEFNIDNYDKHKKNFEFKETFIKNLAYEENTFDESKQDFIEFYRKKQKEAEEGKKLCDQILHSIVDEGIINKDELPIEQSVAELDLKLLIKNNEENNLLKKEISEPKKLKISSSRRKINNKKIVDV